MAPAPRLAGASHHFSLFLGDGALLAAGENVVGQLAQGVAGFDAPTPLAVSPPEGIEGGIASISAGLVHGALLDAGGDVWTWGLGTFGRLGLGDEETRTRPTKVEGALDDREVALIGMGNGASHAVTRDGGPGGRPRPASPASAIARGGWSPPASRPWPRRPSSRSRAAPATPWS